MPNLHDMEELISSIEDNQVKDYMKEAMSCYMTNAYRACIVLTYLALFDDIVKKLKELGKINKKAKKVYDEVQNKINEQGVYENYLIEQLTSNGLIPKLDTDFLGILRQLRNKSAHPSGHSASAEEARFLFYESINRFLSKPILTTTQLVDDILARLDDQHFFPSTNIKKISDVVKKETMNIHYETYPYLINHILEKYLSNDSKIKRNSSCFLSGLAYQKNDHLSVCLKKHMIDKKCSNSKYSAIILRAISANGLLALDLESVTYERLRAILSESIKNLKPSDNESNLSHPSTFLRSILQSCGEDLVISEFKEELTSLFQKNIFSVGLISNMIGKEEIIKIYMQEAYRKAGSTDFETANNFSENISDVDKYLSEILTGSQAFQLITKIYKAAEWNAWRAKSLRNSNFSSIPHIKNIAIDYIISNEPQAKITFKKIINDDYNFDDLTKKYLLGTAL